MADSSSSWAATKRPLSLPWQHWRGANLAGSKVLDTTHGWFFQNPPPVRLVDTMRIRSSSA